MVSVSLCVPNDSSPQILAKKTFRLQLKKPVAPPTPELPNRPHFLGFTEVIPQGNIRPWNEPSRTRTWKISRYITLLKGWKGSDSKHPTFRWGKVSEVCMKKSWKFLYCRQITCWCQKLIEGTFFQHLSMNRGRNETRMALSLRRQEVFDLTWFGGRAKIPFIGEKIMQKNEELASSEMWIDGRHHHPPRPRRPRHPPPPDHHHRHDHRRHHSKLSDLGSGQKNRWEPLNFGQTPHRLTVHGEESCTKKLNLFRHMHIKATSTIHLWNRSGPLYDVGFSIDSIASIFMFIYAETQQKPPRLRLLHSPSHWSFQGTGLRSSSAWGRSHHQPQGICSSPALNNSMSFFFPVPTE